MYHNDQHLLCIFSVTTKYIYTSLLCISSVTAKCINVECNRCVSLQLQLLFNFVWNLFCQVPGVRFISLARAVKKEDQFVFIWCRHRYGHEEYCINKEVRFMKFWNLRLNVTK